VKSSQYVFKYFENCFLGIQGYDLPAPQGPAWVIGNSFMRNYYSVFDVENSRIGFAPLKQAVFETI
jgi:hypothetical protein